MNDTILVGLDGTDPSRVALLWGLERAAILHAPVALVYVLDDESGAVGRRMLDDLRDDAQRLLDTELAYARSIAPTIEIRAKLLTGNPMWELVTASQDVAMAVVGTHKTGFMHGRTFGSSSLQLAAAARTHVAIIPQMSAHGAHGVVVGVADTWGGRAAIRFAAAEAARLGQRLTLLRGWTSPQLVAESHPGRAAWNDQLETRSRVLLSEAATIAREEHGDLEVRLRNVHRAPAEALIDASASSVQLVIGSTRRYADLRMGLGPVIHDALLNVTAPTIVVHSGDQ